MLCIVLYCIELYCISLYFIVFYCILLYFIVFYFIQFYSILFDFIPFYSILFDFIRFYSILLCMYPNEDRVRLLTESVKDLEEWTKKQDKTDADTGYWLPLYIQFQGTRRFQDLRRVPPNMTALTKSQDKIGWRNLTEGKCSNISTICSPYIWLWDQPTSMEKTG